jgi:hypothetical protein
MTVILSRPAVAAPVASPVECRFASRMVAEHGDPADWAADTWTAYQAGIAACRATTVPVLTLQKAKGGAR